MRTLSTMSTKELLSDYRHITCHLREMYEKGNAITGTNIAASKIVELSSLATTQDEKNNITRALSHYLKF